MKLRKEKGQIKGLIVVAVLGLLIFTTFSGCEKGDEEVSLAPYLYENSLTISPNPARAFDKVTFFFAYSDHDGDVRKATVFIRLETEGGDTFYLSPDEGTFEVKGNTNGAMSFELTIKSVSESQGTYYVYIVDEAGNRSNEIYEYLAVNPPQEE